MLPVYLPRLKAPRNHGEFLIYPSADAIGAALGRDVLGGAELLGRSLRDTRELARRETLDAARSYLEAAGEPIPDFPDSTWIVAGHQPELFHPGVWVKNFVLQSLAHDHRATPLNLVVDNDVVKSPSLRVPVGDRVESVPIDRADGQTPLEEREVLGKAIFDSFPERLAPLTRDWPFRPWVDGVWDAMRRAAPTKLLGERIVRGRRALERSMGLKPLEVPLSAICRTAAFARFACAILGNLPRFVDDYNASVHEYRRRHDLKSRNHPAPDLGKNGEAIETPFWVWRAELPRRQRLFAIRTGDGLQLLTGTTPIAALAGPPAAWVDQWPTLERRGVKIRTRALTTTLFSRLLLADIFLHGIGGGKYDEATDDLIRRFFGIEPPTYAVVTATLLLPFRRVAGIDERLSDIRRKERDLWYNPQRHVLAPNAEAEASIAKKRTAMAMPERTHDERVARFRALLRATAELRPLIADRLVDLKADRDDVERLSRVDAVAAARDYAFCLYPEEMLREMLPRLSNPAAR